jgi:hypothetical protein
MQLAPEVRSSAGANDIFGGSYQALAGSLVQLVVVFLVSYLLLFCGMSRRPGMYDEGIVLTGALRVAAGQIPHRDFYFIYGPAEIYILAGLFKVFGPSLLVERLFDLLIKALLVTSMYGIVASYCRRSIAGFVSVVTVLWLFGLSEFGLAITPVSLFNVLGSALLLPVFAGRVSTKRMLAAGAISGAASLFRYDTGSHTRPGQPLYAGLSHHDRVVANDNLIYFATQRLPATHWSHFDPDLQNRLDIQTQMVAELEQKGPPYIVLDSEFELSREPNDSAKSSGVTLLDNYIHDKYQPSESFGTMSIWQRKP